MSSQPQAKTGSYAPLWQRWLPRLGATAAAFTTLCCIGVSAALSLATAVGATFLTQDATLKPVLAATIGLTVLGSSLTWWRHRNPFPLLLTATAGTWVFLFTFVIVGQTAPASGDTMAGMAAGPGDTTVAAPHWPLVWAGLAVFLGAQAWDLIRVRSCCVRAAPSAQTRPQA